MVQKKNLKKIIFGTWPISGDYSKVKNDESIKLLKLAYQNGIKEFDTAPNYGSGRAELLVGKAFENIRFKPKINTKIGNSHDRDKNFDLRKIKLTFEKSLKALKVKKINILFLHNPRKISNLPNIINFLKKLKKEKKINDYGISITKDYKYNIQFLKKFKNIQLDHNIIYIDMALNKYFKKKYIYARSPFASGTIFLKDKKFFLKNDFRYKWLDKERKKNIINQLELIKKKYKKSMLNLALSFLYKDKHVDRIICGLSKKRQLLKLLNQLRNIKKNTFNTKEYKSFYLSTKTFKRKGF